ncbi:MAG TPA: hypothetical protein ENN49_08705 [Bacteroidales bacterium]|nr:hypothetical protein [Bacteroidales bacterium]
MSIEILKVQNKLYYRKFIHLPAKIHRGYKNWVLPIYSDEWDFYNPKKNRAVSYSDTVLYLALKGGRPVGRIVGIINRRYNQIHNEKTARFFNLETFQDYDVAQALLGEVEKWAKGKGMDRLVEPMGFFDKDL